MPEPDAAQTSVQHVETTSNPSASTSRKSPESHSGGSGSVTEGEVAAGTSSQHSRAVGGGAIADSSDGRKEGVVEEMGRIEPAGQQSQLHEGQDQHHQGGRGEMDMDVEMDDGRISTGKRVKVYELRQQSWHDRGTGFCEGIYDEALDEALLVVIPEELPPGQMQPDGSQSGNAVASSSEPPPAPGGFLREGEEGVVDPFLLRSRVGKEDMYQRQQETLIVWTEPNGIDIALSFQDPQGCNDIWEFIQEVQRHLLMIYDEVGAPVSSSSPAPMSPPMSHDPIGISSQHREGDGFNTLSLSNLKEQEAQLKMQSRSIVGREKTVEFLVHNHYVKQMIAVFEQAEDLESLDDLHTLCTMTQTILALNDNSMFEYLLQDDIFLGVVGMLECKSQTERRKFTMPTNTSDFLSPTDDPEFPTLKASYRQFLSEASRFREVVKIEDDGIRSKIHQTYRLLYLKDVVLARMLDDPTFNILNSLLFFNQIDIINHVQTNEAFLLGLFAGFKEDKIANSKSTAPESASSEFPALDERKRDVVLLLHQLMLMGKNVQLPNRLSLYRNLVERGLLFVCEWAIQRPEVQLQNAAAEILSLILDHDVNAARTHVLREHDQNRRTLVDEMYGLLSKSKDLGLKSQMADAMRSLLEVGADSTEISMMGRGNPKDGPTAEAFAIYFYEKCILRMYQPLLEIQDFRAYRAEPAFIDTQTATILQHLTELLSFFVSQHSHRSQFFVLSNPVSIKVASLLYMRQKPLRHSSLRFFRACLKTNNHFVHRHLVKADLMLPLIELLEVESPKDNMLSSACLDVFEMIRKDNMKTIINHIFEKHHPRIQALADRPYLRAFMVAMTTRWEQNNEPAPEAAKPSSEAQSWGNAIGTEEDDYFNGSSDDEIGPKPPNSVAPSGLKRKRQPATDGTIVDKPPGKKLAMDIGGGASAAVPSLGLDYDDDSDGSTESSPVALKSGSPATMGLAPSPMELDEPIASGSASPKLKLKLGKGIQGEELGEVAQKMSQKRKMEEEEEEAGGLAGLMSGGRPGTPRSLRGSTKNTEGASTKASTALGNAVRETGKKIKLSIGFGKKLSGADVDPKKDSGKK